jgi:dihydrofolate reductase
VRVLGGGFVEDLKNLKAEAGKDIWLFGGGRLFRSLMDAGLVDAVEVTVMPVLLGNGVPLLAEGHRIGLRLQESTALPSGILMVKYAVLASNEK